MLTTTTMKLKIIIFEAHKFSLEMGSIIWSWPHLGLVHHLLLLLLFPVLPVWGQQQHCLHRLYKTL